MMILLSQFHSIQYLMLESQARNLEALIKNPKGKGKVEKGAKVSVTWDSPVELDAYIAKLQARAYCWLCVCFTIVGRSGSADD
jgi:hypothetical protein